MIRELGVSVSEVQQHGSLRCLYASLNIKRDFLSSPGAGEHWEQDTAGCSPASHSGSSCPRGGKGINCAEVGTFHVWNFFEVSIPPFPLIPPFLPSPSLSHPHLFLSLSPPLLIRLSLLFFVSFISVDIKAQLIFWESARGDFRANFSVRHTGHLLLLHCTTYTQPSIICRDVMGHSWAFTVTNQRWFKPQLVVKSV